MLATNFGHWESWELRHKVTFDGAQRLAIVNAGVTEIDVKIDLYSDWKEWVRLHENLRFTPAIRTIGGDPTTGAQTAGDIYFMQNNWRLVIDLSETKITGALFSDDFESPLLNQNGTIAFQSIVSSLVTGSPQNVVTGDLGDLTDDLGDITGIVKYITQAIHVSEDAPAGGDGSVRAPFNTVNEAVDFAELVGLDELHIHSNVDIVRNLKNFTVVGIGNPVMDLGGSNTDRSVFYNVTLKGSYTGRIQANNCDLENNLSGLNGRFINCGLNGDLFVLDGGDAVLIDPFSNIEGLGRPSISITGATGTNLGVRGMKGGLLFKGSDHASSKTSIEMVSGKLTLDASNTLGVISVRGSCQFTDSSAGSTVDKTALIAQQVWYDIQI